MPFLCVGLGNPGATYANTRHNTGFVFVDALARCLGDPAWKERFAGLATAVQDEHLGKILLLKPQTYMNASGRSVAECLHFFKMTPKDLIVVHDDLDLPVGTYKIKQKGSHGGHNGLRDIHKALGTDDYRRIRIGIDRPADKALVSDYVLGNFSKEDREKLDRVIDHILNKELDKLFKDA